MNRVMHCFMIITKEIMDKCGKSSKYLHVSSNCIEYQYQFEIISFNLMEYSENVANLYTYKAKFELSESLGRQLTAKLILMRNLLFIQPASMAVRKKISNPETVFSSRYQNNS